MKRFVLIAVCVAIAFSVVACQKKEQTVTTTQQQQQQPMTPPHPMGGQMGGGQPGANLANVAITYALPEGWTRLPPASMMRMDQATIPGAAGQGDLAVFFFGSGQGGSVEDNLNRWADQMTAGAEPKRENFDANGYKMTFMEKAGTLNPSTMGMGPQTPQPNSMMYAAVVEGEGGPWFFKATGPAATLQPQRDAFLNMIKSVRPNKPAAAV